MLQVKNIVTKLFLLLIISVPPDHFLSAQDASSPLLLIYDASGSMWGKIDEKTKKEVASEVLANTIDNLSDNQQVGLIAYGHREKGDCKDVEFLVDLANADKNIIKSKINAINPLGKTPLAYSAKMAINTLRANKTKATIILITDGIESCNGNLCEVVKLAKAEGIEFKLHIVGFGLKDDELDALKCAAKEGEGNYYDAENADQLSEALNEAVNVKVDDPIPNHSFYSTKNGKPVDVWIKIKDKVTGEAITALRTYQDTVKTHLQIGNYTVNVQPLEGSDIVGKTISLEKKTEDFSHTDISFEGGKLDAFITNNGEGWDATIRVIDPSSNKIVATGRTYGRHKIIEVNEGVYSVKILPMQIKGKSTEVILEQISVRPAETTTMLHNFDSGILSIGVQNEAGELVDASIKIKEVSDSKYVAGGRTYTTPSNNPKEILILPGKYKVSINTLGIHKGVSQSQILEAKPGEKTTYIFKID